VDDATELNSAPSGYRRPDIDAAIAHALGRLDRELSPRLYYHSVRHTRDDVLPAVTRLAEMEGVTGEQLILLRVAAAYHDIGFTVQYADHEAAGICIARQALRRFGFSSDHIQLVSGMIRATRLSQEPTNLLEALLADADLDSLGRDDFFARSRALRAELAERGPLIDEATWYVRQLSFLQAHRYWTASARSLRNPQKQRNIALLAARLAVQQPARSGGQARLPRD
jgi:uncharacterized protein